MARRLNDAYYSAKWMTYFLLQNVDIYLNQSVLEPCCGEGAISNYLKQEGYQVITNDINPVCVADMHCDYLDMNPELTKWVHWVVTNPPYNDAFGMLQKAMDDAEIGVAMLLRLSFVEPTDDRGLWLEKHPPTVRITLPRYSFTGDGRKDNVTSEWMVWLHGSHPQKNVIVSKESLAQWIREQG